MEIVNVFFGLMLLVVIPSLVFLTYNHFIQYFLLKPSHHGFLKTLKKTWWTSILWVLIIFGSFITLSGFLPDSMITRILVTLLILAVLFGINALNQKRMISEEGAKKDYFKKSMIASFGVSFLIIIITFIVYFPHKIITVTDKAKFLTHIDFISSCNTTLKSLNERGIANGDLLHAFYNEDEMELVGFIQLSPADRIELMKQFKFEKIDTSQMDSYYFNIMNNEIKSAVDPIGIQTISPKRIGLDNIYQFSRPNVAISMNMSSSYKFGDSFPLKCDKYLEHYCYVEMIFDTKSNILLLVESIHNDGP
jgi:hypothetical protein